MKSIQKFKLFTVFHTIFALLAILSYGLRVEAFSYAAITPVAVNTFVLETKNIQYVTAIDSSGVFVEKRFVAKATALDSCNTLETGRAIYIPRLQNTFSLNQELNCFSLSLNVGSFSDQETLAVNNLTNSSVEHILVFKETPKIAQFGLVSANTKQEVAIVSSNGFGYEFSQAVGDVLETSYTSESFGFKPNGSVLVVNSILFEVLRC